MSTFSGSQISNHLLTVARLGKLIQAYLHYAETHLYPRFSSLITILPRLLLEMEQSFTIDARIFVADLLALKAWFIRFLSTGLKDQGGLPSRLWDQATDLPLLIGDFLLFIISLKTVEEKAMISAFLLNILSISELSIEAITAKAVEILSNEAPATSEPATPYFESGLSAMGLSTLTLFCRLQSFASSVFGFLIRGIGPNGVLGWTAVSDARSLVNSKLFEQFTALVGVIGGHPLLTKLHLAAKLPLISNFVQVANLFNLILTVTADFGVKAVVGVNYWLLVLIRPFYVVAREVLHALPQFVASEEGSVPEAVKAATGQGASFLGFNVIETSFIPIGLISSFLDSLFGRNIGSLFVDIFSPKTIGNPELGMEIGTPGLLLRGVLAFRYIVIFMFVVLINSCAASLGITDRNTFYFNSFGDFFITNTQLAEKVLELFNKLGITVGKFEAAAPGNDYSFASFGNSLFWAGINITGLNIFIMNAMLVMNSLAWRVQVGGQLSGFFTTADLFWKWIVPLINAVDAKHLTMLNTLPSIISGITKPLLVGSLAWMAEGAWYSINGFTNNDAVQLYVYVVMVDVLTRLDSALRICLNYAQFATMASSKERIDRYIDEAGKAHPFSSLRDLVTSAMNHPFIWAFQSIIALAISTLFVLTSLSGTALRIGIIGVYEILLLLSSFNLGAVDYSWYLLQRNHITKVIKLMQGLKGKGPLPTITHTTKLPGYGHPFVVTFVQGQNTTISTIGMSASLPTFDQSGDAVTRLTFFNPYVS